MFGSLDPNVTLSVDQPEVCECFAKSIPREQCTAVQPRSSYLTCNRLLSQEALVFFMWILGASALFGNIFVLTWRKLRHQRENKVQSLLLSNLALSDLIMGIYMLIIASADAYFGQYFPLHSETWRTGISCKLTGALGIISSEASVFFVTLISVDRFIRIRFPHSTHKLQNSSTWITASAMWLGGNINRSDPISSSRKVPRILR